MASIARMRLLPAQDHQHPVSDHKVTCRIYSDLAQVEAVAGAALTRERVPALFDRFAWYAHTYRLCGVGGAPLVVHAADGPAAAWLFLTLDADSHARALASWYTLAFAPVFCGTPGPAQREALLAAMARALTQAAVTVALSPMPEPACRMMERSFAAHGWFAAAEPVDHNWTTQIAGRSFAEFWAGRPGQLRKTVKSKRNQANMQIAIHTAFNAGAWADYADVYADSWKPDEGSLDFLRAMAEREGRAGTLRLGIGSIGGAAVAAQLWTCENGVAIAHKVAHRESARALSPGSILSAAMFARAIDDDRVATIDFGTGNQPYKASWMEQCAPLYSLRLFNKTQAAGLVAAARAYARQMAGKSRQGAMMLRARLAG